MDAKLEVSKNPNQSSSLELGDMDSICTKLEKTSDETLYISVNLSANKFKYGGSSIGKKFLEMHSDVVDNFFKFCRGTYGHSESSFDGNKLQNTNQRKEEVDESEDDCHMYIVGMDDRSNVKKRKLKMKDERNKIYEKSDKRNKKSEKSDESTKKCRLKVDDNLISRRRSARVKDSADILKKAQMRKASMDSFTSSTAYRKETLVTKDAQKIQDETKQKRGQMYFIEEKIGVDKKTPKSQESCPKEIKNKKISGAIGNFDANYVVTVNSPLLQIAVGPDRYTQVDNLETEANLESDESFTKSKEPVKTNEDENNESRNVGENIDKNDTSDEDNFSDNVGMEDDESSKSDNEEKNDGKERRRKNKKLLLKKEESRKNIQSHMINCRLCHKKVWRKAYPFHLRRTHKELNAFICDECPRSFNTYIALKKHKVLHSGREANGEILNKDYNNILNKEDGEQQDLKKEQKDGFICNICLKVLCSKASLDHHRAMVHNEQLICKVCKIQCSTAQRLAIHEAIHQDKKYPCENCSKEFLNPNSFVCHAKKDHSDHRPACYICGILFETEIERNKHWLIHKKDRLNNYACSKCGKTFENLKYLKTHNKSAHRSDDVICKVCCEFFTSKTELKKHMWKHRLDPMYTCRMCKSSFKTTEELTQHTKDAHNYHYYMCDACGEEFDCTLELKKHQRSVHDPKVKVTCGICNAIFFNHNYLKKHIEQVHCETRDYQCDECGKFFKTKGTLKSHAKCHREENLNKCELCEETFKSINGLHNHVLDHHADKINIEKLDFMVYECEFCGKRSSQKAIHIRHVRTHTGEKPYVCSECGARFPIPAALNRHVKRKHLGLKKHHCKICDTRFADHSHLRRHYQTNLHKLLEAASTSNSIEAVQSGYEKRIVKSQVITIPASLERSAQIERKEVDIIKRESEGQPSMEEIEGFEKENIQVIYVDHIAQTNSSIKQEVTEQVYEVEDSSLINFKDSTIYVISEAEDPNAFVQSLSFTE